MNPKHLPILIFLFLLLLPCTLSAVEFKIVRVYDGDTVKAVGHNIEIKIRLVGIDAPETAYKKKGRAGQPFADKSKKYLAGMVLNKNVTIKGYGLDIYNRLLGEILLNGRNINLEMVRAGYAEVYRGQPPAGFNIKPYTKAEAEARAKKIKIWSLGKKYVSPGQWRQKYRQ